MIFRLNILLVEDNPGDAELIKEYIFDTSLRNSVFTEAHTLQEAIMFCVEQDFDVILLDLGLPDSNGLSTITKLLQCEKKVPIIVLTGLEDEKIALDAIRLGAQDYITKSNINPDVLVRILRYSIERKRTQEALFESEKKYRDLVNHITDGIYNTDLQGKFTFVNDALCKIFGYYESELLGKPFSMLVEPEKREEFVSRYNESFKTGRSSEIIEVPAITEDGSSITVEIKPVVQYEKGEPAGSRGVVRDVTERKNWEQQLEESEVRYRSFVENFHGIAFRSFLNGIPIYFHGAVKEITGYTEAEFINGYPRWEEIIYQDDQERLARSHDQKILSDGFDIEREYRIVRKDGKIAWVHDYIQTIFDYTRNKNILQGAIYDVTERKKAEEELSLSREQLKMANSILRHDVTNDLSVIQSAVEIFQDEKDDQMLDEIEKRVNMSMDTIRKQRSREKAIETHAQLDEYEIEHVLHDVAQDYKNIKISISGHGRAYADQSIYSVFKNIISNAIQHGKTSSIDIGVSYKGNFCEIRIADNGIGIPDDLKEKVFYEGYSFGKDGHTGIGLHIVKQTIKDYAGEVFVEDNKPKGTVFIVRLRKGID
ncbi:MAG: PAS domain S-box protein [Candidatus Cloacimonetes bacterium]|nr:PAS domain S-box protein [Candidatus Cloacimonadota bacterium]